MKTFMPALAATGMIVALAALPAAAEDTQGPAPDRNTQGMSQCAFADLVNNWQEVDNRTVIIETGINKRFRVTFMNECRNMRFALTAKLVSRPGICVTPGDRMVFRNSPGFDDVCVIQSIERLPKPVKQTPVSN